MTRYEIINCLIEHHGYKNYLEIGTRDGACFTKIRCLRKTGVDPVSSSDHPSHKMTSDQFFAGLDDENMFDLIFIDGLHLETQVDKDIENSLRHLSSGGSIVLHDCNPPTALHAAEKPLFGPPTNGNWNGTVYRSLIKLRLARLDLSLLTVDSDWGVGILTKESSATLDADPEEAMTWEFFERRRQEILKLISPEDFRLQFPPSRALLEAPHGIGNDFESPCPFHILESVVGYGYLGRGPQLGYDDLEATNYLRCRWVLSAHATSRLVIEVGASINVLGFLNGTAIYCPAAEFFVDGQTLGKVESAFEATKTVHLQKGTHLLEIRAPDGNRNCHTVWGFEPDQALLLPPKFYVAIGSICKDENDYLEEWVRHHLAIGVEHFYLLDNGSKTPLRQSLQEAGLSEWVTVEDYDSDASDRQNSAYTYLCKKFSAACFWMALIDIDEFIIPKLVTSLSRMLQAFEEFGGIFARWVMFGADGHELKPARQLGSYKNSYVDGHVKMILQPRFVTGFRNAHSACFMAGREAVGDHFDGEPSTQHLQINHYWTRSRSEWADKIARGAVVPGYERCWADFDRHNERCIYRDHTIETFWRRIKEPNAVSNDTPVFGFIHVAAVNDWHPILLSQLKKCRQSGLWDRTQRIYLGIVGGNGETLQKLGDLPGKVSVLFFRSAITCFEFPTLAALQHECAGPYLKYVWYIHSKGVTNPYEGQRRWRAKMEEFILIHYELAISKLDKGYFAAAGFGSHNPNWHIPGNFWWARSDYIKTLPKISSLDWSNRWAAERWICENGLTGLYLHDYGDTVFDDFEILTSSVGAGVLTTGDYHGWSRIPVLVGKHFPQLSHYLSAHAPSQLEIKITKKAKLIGFVSGSGESKGWTVEFLVNGNPIGRKDRCNDCTEEVPLGPGLHKLEIVVTDGEHWGAHSCWGILFETRMHAFSE